MKAVSRGLGVLVPTFALPARQKRDAVNPLYEFV
jgi:hypothetical protein